jgi:peptidoglycan L-alanyl-D-glutamate endopeptidase CwlK
MSKYSFGQRSRTNIGTCDPRLIRIAERALSFGIMDFSVIEGHRSVERQQMLYNSKPPKTKIDGITKKGKHNYSPSLAMDLLPHPAEVNDVGVWQDKQRFCVLAGLIYAAASLEGINIRWGGDWDSDGNNADSTSLDLPHFEIGLQ